jgi:hypothetical protein
MSAFALNKTNGIYTYDFSHNAYQAYGISTMKNMEDENYALYGGDLNADGKIDEADYMLWSDSVGFNGYKALDGNLDGEINNQDKNDIWWPNQGEEDQLPD